MAWFEDLAPCDYFATEHAACLRAVGWLERGRPFVCAQRDPRVFEKLRELAKSPWQPAMAAGPHACDLCLYEPAMGSANLFIPAGAVIYVAPELVIHYMNAHGYGPPEEFCAAVLACPPMRSQDYLKAILSSGGRRLTK